jgi:hypothetical protein
MEFSSTYSENNRRRFLVAAAILICGDSDRGLADETVHFHRVSVFVSDFSGRGLSSALADHNRRLGLRGSPGTPQQYRDQL